MKTVTDSVAHIVSVCALIWCFSCKIKAEVLLSVSKSCRGKETLLLLSVRRNVYTLFEQTEGESVLCQLGAEPGVSYPLHQRD